MIFLYFICDGNYNVYEACNNRFHDETCRLPKERDIEIERMRKKERQMKRKRKVDKE